MIRALVRYLLAKRRQERHARQHGLTLATPQPGGLLLRTCCSWQAGGRGCALPAGHAGQHRAHLGTAEWQVLTGSTEHTEDEGAVVRPSRSGLRWLGSR